MFAFYWRVAVRPYLRETVALGFIILGGAVFDMVSVGLTVPFMDVLTDPQRAGQNPIVVRLEATLQSLGIVPSTNVVIFALLLAVSVFFAMRSLFFALNQYYSGAIAIKLRRTMKALLFEKFLNARYADISKRARGMVINDINTPANSLAGAIANLCLFFTGVFNSLLMIGLLLYLSWRATALIGLLAFSCVQGWRILTDRRSAAHGRMLYGLYAEQNKLQVDAIDGLKVVKAHALERQLVERQKVLFRAEIRPELQLVWFRSGPTLVNELLAIVIVLGLGAMTFLFPSLGIQFSTLAAFLFAVRRIAPSMTSINSASVNLNTFKRNLEVIEEVLEHLPQEKRGGKLVGTVEEVRFAQATFSYASRPDHQVLKAFTATMRRGTVTAIVGPTGAGKSTIANLLMGLYELRSGSVFITGTPMDQVDVQAWRSKVGYVPQDVFVFNATIRENITLGDDRVPVLQMEWAARVAQLHEFIASLPEGYDTVVGDRGLRLSGGQCQRLAIARAILRRPDVLVFDEATSALDNLTERAVYNAIGTLHRDAIVIVIAHRLSTVREADQILVLQGGRMVESGTHETLISQRGVYAKLYEEDDQASAQSAEAATVVAHDAPQ